MAGIRYRPEVIETGLKLMVRFGGSAQRAKEVMDSQNIRVTRGALESWKNRQHPDRYRELWHELGPELQKEQAAEFERITSEQQAKLLEAVRAFKPENIPDRDLPNAIRSLAIAAGVTTEKGRLLREQPTEITLKRSSQEILDNIERINPALVVDGEAEEIEDVKELSA